MLAFVPGAVAAFFLMQNWLEGFAYSMNLLQSWWIVAGAGLGAKSLGTELAQTRQFATCQVKKVFEKVCYRTPNGPADTQAVETIATVFETNNRSMKRVFAETALYCMGD